jgi:hypothetical protein
MMPEKVDASIAEAAQIVPEAVGADPLPQAELPVIPLLPPQMTMFMPSALQATLYRIDVSLKRPWLSLPDEAAAQWEQPDTQVAELRDIIDVCAPEVPEILLDEDLRQSVAPTAAAELHDVGYEQASRTKRHAAVAAIVEGATVQEIAGSSEMDIGSEIGAVDPNEKGIEAAELIEAIEAVDVNEAATVAELTAAPETAQVPVEEDHDLGYLALYSELVAPVSGLRKVELQGDSGFYCSCTSH